jgi:hypothetical protein
MARRRLLVLAAAVAAVTSSPLAQRQPAALRFHHVHVRVADPAAAMSKYTRANSCTSVVLQGVGVGVRCGQSYLLFDRDDQPAAGAVARGAVTVNGSGDRATVRVRIAADDVSAARGWFSGRLGLDVSRSVEFVDARRTPERATPDTITHVAFASADPSPAVAAIAASGVAVIGTTEDSTIVAGPGGLPIELVRDAGLGPDAYWCPMHPDVRSPVPGSCTRCGMTLVPIPPPVFGDYRLRVGSSRLGQNRDRLSMEVIDPSSEQRATRLLNIHERLIHVFLVSRDLGWFQHVHPDETPDGRFTLDVTWPGPGQYALTADFYPAGGTPQLLQTMITTPDYRGPAFPSAPDLRADANEPKTAGSLRVALTAPALTAGSELKLTFTLTDVESGAPVSDLEPYLGAPGHLFFASADLVDAVHSHPLNLKALGPAVSFDVTFPRPGLHKLWLQFQRRGAVVTVPFVVDVGG